MKASNEIRVLYLKTKLHGHIESLKESQCLGILQNWKILLIIAQGKMIIDVDFFLLCWMVLDHKRCLLQGYPYLTSSTSSFLGVRWTTIVGRTLLKTVFEGEKSLEKIFSFNMKIWWHG
jgi:hypothetical protein